MHCSWRTLTFMLTHVHQILEGHHCSVSDWTWVSEYGLKQDIVLCENNLRDL